MTMVVPQVTGVGLRMLAQFQGSKMSPGLFQDIGQVYKVLRLPQLLVELWVPNQGYSQSAGAQSVVII